ncbi:hypothetical protein [Geitlerinema sp. PCC 9228]|uniref:hypothetical protein n=1 Tax=Geitlerinema sp. PCC 9228 TaxID=111611 RepID=UPI0008F9B033|nr:hypothetical protein [Geitlerinema sp. PCC 9228]
MDNFGVVIACCQKDYNFAKGCCASVRYFLGDVPICLIVDGRFSTQKLQETYQVTVINQEQVRHPELRKKSFGFGLTKMVAFWESPWEYFLFLDADTVVWGDILQYKDFESYDLLVDYPAEKNISHSKINQEFIDIAEFQKHFPEFPWQKMPFWVTGVFFAKRGIFDLDEYLDLLKFSDRYPDVFKYGEQGMLNFMACRAAAAGRIRLKTHPIQTLVLYYSREFMQQNFSTNESGPVYNVHSQPSVIHWAGAKPFFINSDFYYNLPMNFFREKFLLDGWNLSGNLAQSSLLWEDFYCYRPKQKFVRKLLQRSFHFEYKLVR